MDAARKMWHFADMRPAQTPPRADPAAIPVFGLYGESRDLPDVLHIETITHRAAGLDWKIAPHRHLALHQIFVIRSGSVRLSLDGRTSDLTPPVLFSVPQGVVHGFAFAAGTEGWVLTVPLQTLPDLLGPSVLRETALGRAGILAVDDEILRLFRAIEAEHHAMRPARAIVLRALATQVACHVLRHPGQDQPEPAPRVDERVAQFRTLVQQHLRDRWTLPDFARALGLSDRHLSRICRAATGHPAASLIEAARMREACRLLAYTRAPVASVGYDLGFDDPSYFSRAFRRAMGQSPQVYRARLDAG